MFSSENTQYVLPSIRARRTFFLLVVYYFLCESFSVGSVLAIHWLGRGWYTHTHTHILCRNESASFIILWSSFLNIIFSGDVSTGLLSGRHRRGCLLPTSPSHEKHPLQSKTVSPNQLTLDTRSTELLVRTEQMLDATILLCNQLDNSHKTSRRMMVVRISSRSSGKVF